MRSIKHTNLILYAIAFIINIKKNVANILTRLFEKKFNIIINRKNI